MALTTEQIDFAKAKSTTVTNTAAKLMEFFKPINEEGLIVKDFKSSFLGGTDGMGFWGIGCIGGFVLPIIIGIICAILDFSDNNIVILCELTLVVMIEFSIIGYIYNKIFLSKHPGAPGDPDRLTHLIMPLIDFLISDYFFSSFGLFSTPFTIYFIFSFVVKYENFNHKNKNKN